MAALAKVIPLFPNGRRPVARAAGGRRQGRSTDGIKFFTADQIRLLRATAQAAAARGRASDVKAWALIDLITGSGVRVAEAADVRCGDVHGQFGESALFVRCGKGCKSRTVEIDAALLAHLGQFTAWKATHDEGTGPDDHLFIGQRGPLSAQGIQVIIKKRLKALNLYRQGKSVHSLRHSYATQLYRRERDLRAVQRQLGHASVETTQVYSAITPEDIQTQIAGLWEVQ